MATLLGGMIRLAIGILWVMGKKQKPLNAEGAKVSQRARRCRFLRNDKKKADADPYGMTNKWDDRQME
jgi:hypothetical protein